MKGTILHAIRLLRWWAEDETDEPDIVEVIKQSNECAANLERQLRTSAWKDGADVDLDALACLDCGLPYADFPLDTTLPDEQWRLIHPDDGGVLCACCIVRRAAKLPGAVAVRARIEIEGADGHR